MYSTLLLDPPVHLADYDYEVYMADFFLTGPLGNTGINGLFSKYFTFVSNMVKIK